MTGSSKERHEFDLEVRTTEFAKRVIRLCKALPRNAVNSRLVSQAVGSAGSVGANYREANDSLGKKDFVLRLRISRKEAKEVIHWMELIEEANPEFSSRMKELYQEADELKKILSAIIEKSI
jgi:four helix bundle protein